MSGSQADQLQLPFVVLGAGPAGLTAGYALAKTGHPVVVLEAEDQVGGLAKTVVDPDGYRFDLGGHRFFTKNQEVNDLWFEVLGDEFLERPRLSRIYWRGRFLQYPLEGRDVVKKLGLLELLWCGLSYLKAAVLPKGEEENIEQWITNRFGNRLYRHFFQTYTEKVWGMPGTELSADWAAQRIQSLSFVTAARAAIFGNDGNRVRSLINSFWYPRYGPGQMWETMADRIIAAGGEVRLRAPVTRIEHDGSRVVAVHTPDERIEAASTISSLPLRSAVALADPAAPPEVRDAAQGLRYRDFLTVALVIEGDDLFPDNWIYVHDPAVRVGRIQNFRSWSPWMVPDPATASIGMEYFCFKGDELWSMGDDDLVALATSELSRLGLARPGQVRRGQVVRVPMAYPIYDDSFAERVTTMRAWLDPLADFQQVGRNGLHRYNNSDHSMLSALRAVENAVAGTDHDIWSVNVEPVYHETTDEAHDPYLTTPVTVYERQPVG